MKPFLKKIRNRKLLNLLTNRKLHKILLLLLILPLLLGITSLFDTGVEIHSLKLVDQQEIGLGDNSVLGVDYDFTHKAITVYATNSDFRMHVLSEYFKRYHSPLVEFAQEFVEACDKYQAPQDCTTIAAIAFVETRLCTRALSEHQKNCWGFGGSGRNRIVFNTFNQAIDFVTKTMVQNYGNYYMQNPVLMQYTYCGPNCHSWGIGVQNSRKEISRLSEQLGYPKLF